MKTLSSYYRNFSIYDTYKIPSSLRDVLYEAWQNSYEELYEESKKNTKSLEETCVNILNAFDDNDVESLHYRYLCMAIIMSEQVKQTIKNYLPNDSRTETSLNYVHNFLQKEKKYLILK